MNRVERDLNVLVRVCVIKRDAERVKKPSAEDLKIFLEAEAIRRDPKRSKQIKKLVKEKLERERDRKEKAKERAIKQLEEIKKKRMETPPPETPMAKQELDILPMEAGDQIENETDTTSSLNKTKVPKEPLQDDRELSNLMEGAFIISRSLYCSEVWFQPPIFVKAWIWMIGEANHGEVKRGDFTYYRGEFFITYDQIREALRFYRKHKKVELSMQQARDLLNWFVRNKMIEKTPVKRVHNLTLTSPPPHQNAFFTRGETTDKRTYLGLKIKIINYDTYQLLENYKNRPKNRGQKKPKNRGTTEVQHYNNKGKDIPGRVKKEKPAPDHRVKEFFDFWEKLYLQERGIPYVFNYKREGDNTKHMLKVHSLETIQKAAEKLFKDEDTRRKRAYNIGRLTFEINRLVGSTSINPFEQAQKEKQERDAKREAKEAQKIEKGNINLS